MKILALLLAFFRFGGLDFASMMGGLTGGLFGMSNAQSVPHANFNTYGNTRIFDSAAQGAMTSMQGDVNRNISMVDPSLQSSYANLQGIDTSGLIGAGAQAGAQYGDLAGLSQLYSGILGNQAGQQFGAGADLYGLGRDLYGKGQDIYAKGQDIYDLGRDPNNQLHNYLQQQNVDQSRAASSARGIGMGANAAGLENDANRNFEMNWQNNLLNRAATGMQGAATGMQGAATGMRGATAGLQGMNQANYIGGLDLSGSMNMGAMAPDYTIASAQAPIAGQQASYGAPMDWANMYTQAQNQDVLGPLSGLLQSTYPYLSGGSQAQQAQFGGNLNAVNSRNQMQQQSQYGLWGGGQSSTPFMGGNQSGAGNPMNWIGMSGGFGGM